MVREALDQMAADLREQGAATPFEVNITPFGYEALKRELAEAGILPKEPLTAYAGIKLNIMEPPQ